MENPVSHIRPWQPEFTALRRDLHMHPELGFEEHRTAKIVCERLTALEHEREVAIYDILENNYFGPCDANGKLRSFVNVYVNDEDIRYLAKENTPTKDGDTISIIPSIAGGMN